MKKQPEMMIVPAKPKTKDQLQLEMDSLAADIADDLTEDKPLDKEQALAESIRILGRMERIDTLSEMEVNEIPLLCAIDMMAKEFRIPELEDLSDNFVKYRVSKGRKGRKGIEEILKSTLNEKESFFGNIRQRMNSWVG
jgi:hypothetical protein